MTQLHAGGKFENTSDDNAYKVSGGLHGVGVSVVNALSEWLDLTIWRDGEEHYMRFSHGDVGRAAEGRRQDRGKKRHPRHLPAQPRDVQDHSNSISSGSSTASASSPSSTRASAWSSPMRATTSAREVELYYEGGIAAFVKYLDRAKTPLMPDPIAIHGQRDDIGIDVALEWNDSYYENVLPSPTTSRSATAAPTSPRSAPR